MSIDTSSRATEKNKPQWLLACESERIDPQEVKLVYERFEAYRAFTLKSTGSAIALDQWFRFYHLEKNSEGLQAGAPVEGCSADGDAVNNSCLLRPAEFLQVLQAFATHTDYKPRG